MMTNNDLADQIEQLVRKHIESTRIAAASAVERAFTAMPRDARTPTRANADGSAARGVARRMAPRRAAEDLATLAEQFYAVLCRNPGETMTTLAPQIGAPPPALHVAVARLKRAGRVRTVGQRQFTRYFPMTNTTTIAA